MSSTFLNLAAEARTRRPRLALILGSGLGSLADGLANTIEVSFGAIPGLETPTVSGHRGSLMLGEWAGQVVLVFAGRLHAYEGQPWQRVVQPVRIASELGCECLLVTNAAGGIRGDLNAGDLVAIVNHIEWTRPDCWNRRASPKSAPYAPRLIAQLRHAAKQLGRSLPTGVYAQVTGPSYETPAEIRALRAWGADVVGMSTAREVKTGFDLGLECAAISLVTNKAAGLGNGPVNHDEVLATAANARLALTSLLEMFLRLESPTSSFVH
jgi:purine-nucleoside phosphorylase